MYLPGIILYFYIMLQSMSADFTQTLGPTKVANPGSVSQEPPTRFHGKEDASALAIVSELISKIYLPLDQLNTKCNKYYQVETKQMIALLVPSLI